MKHVIIIIIIIIIIISISIIIITQRAVDLACEKGASSWLTVIPLKDMDFDLNKRDFVMLWGFDIIVRYPIIRQYAFVGACLQ